MKPFFFILAVTSIVLAACSNPQNNDIEELLAVREQALETKDVDLYLTIISPNYKEVRDEKEFGLKDLKEYFIKTYPIFNTLNITNTDRSIYIDGKKADVFQINRVEATINNEKSVFQIKEKMVLENVGDKWLIVKESDADYFTGYAFGNIE